MLLEEWSYTLVLKKKEEKWNMYQVRCMGYIDNRRKIKLCKCINIYCNMFVNPRYFSMRLHINFLKD